MSTRWSRILQLQLPQEPLTFQAHRDSVANRAVFSPGGTLIASAGSDSTVQIIEWNTNTVVKTLEGHTMAVMSVEWSPSGRLVATASQDGCVIIWDAQTYEMVSRYNLNPWLVSYRASIGRMLHAPRAALGNINFISWNPSGSLLAVCKTDGTVVIIDHADGFHWSLVGHAGPVWCAAWQPGGNLLATTSDDHTVIVWNPTGNERLVRILRNHKSYVNTVAWSLDGRRLFSGSSDSLIVVCELGSDPSNERVLATLQHHSKSVYNIACSPCGRFLASGSRDGTVAVFDAYSYELLDSLRSGTSRVMTVTWGPCGHILAALCDGSVKVLTCAVSQAVWQAMHEWLEAPWYPHVNAMAIDDLDDVGVSAVYSLL